MQEIRNGRVFHYKRQLYTLAVILLAVLFFYFLHIALYHCPKNNVTKRKGKKETKQESPTQYKVVDPISLADLENIHTRKGKYPTRPPPFGQLTWEEAKREKEEKLKKLRK